ncbi:glycoside hydrolase family 13 protein [Nocardiopsis gilva]
MITSGMSAPRGTPETDAWWRDAVIYQIYPRSFADGDDNGTGDLIGVAQRIGHLADLGVDALWLSPFYPSPMADGGYDVADYRDVDPRFGSLDDFDALVEAAHGRGIRIYIDIVPNHTSSAHPWFQAALAAPKGSAERDRYVFRDGLGPDGDQPPSNWASRFGGSAWSRTPDGQWYLHLFHQDQPDLNWSNPEVRAEFDDILRFWCRRGVDGFRIDVAYAMVKDLDEPLRDVVMVPSHADEVAANPDHPFLDRPEVRDIHREWRRILDGFTPPRVAIGEIWLPTDRRLRYLGPDKLHQAFDFDFLLCPWDAAAYRAVIDEAVDGATAAGSVPTWVLGNHDTVRPASKFGLPPGTDTTAWLMSDGTAPPADPALGLRRARAAALLQLALPGAAYIYQGEELGLPEVADLSPEQLQDPVWERSRHTAKGRDGCRVPIPWEKSGPSLGFGRTAGWLPQPEDWSDLSVAAQTGDPGSTLEMYRAALRARRALSPGTRFTWDRDLNVGYVLAFRRDDHLIVVNTGSTPVPLPPGEAVVASTDLPPAELPGDATVWLRTG